MSDYDEIFCEEVPRPARVKSNPERVITSPHEYVSITPSDNDGGVSAKASKPKRKYTRKHTEAQKEPKEAKKRLKTPSTPPSQEDEDAALLIAERVFDSEQVIGYYAITDFIKLYAMIRPECRECALKIIEGLTGINRH